MTTARRAACWAGILLGVLATIVGVGARPEGGLFVALKFFAMLAGVHTAVFLAMYLWSGRALYLRVLLRALPAIAAIAAVAAAVLQRVG